MTLVDDYSRKLWIFNLKYKSDALEKFKQWKVLIEKQNRKRVKRLRTDNGMKYCSEEFEKFCRNEGIVRHKIATSTPQQYGLAKRFNRTILERTGCMLISVGLPKTFWAEVVTTSTFLINRCPSTTLNFKTPEEI